jgi:histidine ammonia-lyase
MEHVISKDVLQFADLRKLQGSDIKLSLSRDAAQRVELCRRYLDDKIASGGPPLYGITTGFGSLYNKKIPDGELEKLQDNLVKSHACGTGAEVPEPIVRWMLFLKAQSLSYGYSGVQLQTVQRLIDFFNAGVYPRIYEMGSLGASGDLAPLAHLSLPMIGLGEVRLNGEIKSGAQLEKTFGWKPLHFKAKEGLALLNGTQFMSAYGVECLIQAKRIMRLANITGALSLDCFDGRLDAFDRKVHRIRPQAGQSIVAEEVSHLLEGSQMIARPKTHVQDPYSFRCIPQVHGATCDTLNSFERTILAEINGVSDNPIILPEEDAIISAGNFHGQPLALAFDFLAVAFSELGNISERRTYQLISGARGLPNYLVANPGINSGLMIPQYTAASLVSQNKQLSTPASVDSIVSSNGQEDHVSMGANAATKALKVLDNVYSILAIEWLTATQALHFRRPAKTSPALEELVGNFRDTVPFIEEDRLLHDDMVRAERFMKEVAIDEG